MKLCARIVTGTVSLLYHHNDSITCLWQLPIQNTIDTLKIVCSLIKYLKYLTFRGLN
jgi:hypothetical protein